MPAKNRIKIYQENGYYHLYNRGVAKQPIFLDDQDYKVFLSYLKEYLSPPLQGRTLKSYPSRKHKNFSNEIDLLCYCLVKNHFHLLAKQQKEDGITRFVRSLITRYSMYFNNKNNRVGSVFQGRYKAVLVSSDEQLLHLTRYIHQNPDPTGPDPVGFLNYKYSSLPNYLGKFKQNWVKPQEVLKFFKQDHPTLSYQAFVTENQNKNLIQDITID
jgi:putative transposase